MSQGVRRRRAWLCGTFSWASVAAAGLGVIAAAPADAGQLPVGAFQVYNSANASTIQPGPFALYTVPVDSLAPTQMNEGLTEVDKKATGFDILQPSQQETTASLLGDIEPVVIGPGGKLYLTDGHHTFTALEDSAYGASNLPVYVDIIANYSSDTMAQFWAQMQSSDFLLPLNDGVPQIVNLNTGSPIPTALTGLTSDVYRGLEYSILKNKNSKLFTTTNNIAGVIGSSKPGLDKITGLYGDFIWADAYRNANGGLGLPYLSPGDIQLATQWNLTPTSPTFEPNIPVNSQISGPNGANVEVGQLPGAILNGNIVINGTISNGTLANGTLDGTQTGTFDESTTFGSFKGITQFNLGTPTDPIMVGTPQVGLVMQLGADTGHTVTLTGNNTYTGGTYIIAGTLIIGSDAALGAAPPESNTQFNSSLNLNSQGFPTNALTAIQADNGVVFDSLTEGNGTLTIGTTAGGGTNTFTTSRPIGIDSEAATINVNGYIVTLGGPLVSLGTNDVALGNATGESDLTIDDLSAGDNGKLILSTSSPDFFGNIIIGNTGAPVVEAMSDAALGATSVNGTVLPVGSPELGQIELNGGTLQIGAANFTSNRGLFLGGGSSFDTNGFNSTVFSGTLTDVQRTLTFVNSGATAGAVGFGSLAAGSTAIIALNAGTGTTGGPGNSVTFTNGITRNGNTDTNAPANATVFIDPLTGSTLGSGVTNGVEVFSSGASATNTNGIAPVWIITDSGGSASSNPYNFLTYGAHGYTIATYTSTFGATNVVQVATSPTISSSQAYALNIENSKTLTINGGNTLTIGDGTDPAGLILEGTTLITGGTLAFGASEAVIDVKSTNTINSAVTGTGGLTLAGSGTLVLGGTAGGLSGPITVDSGTLQLNTANYFPTSGGGTTVWLSNVKSKPSNAILAVDANNVISALNSDGNNSTVTIATGVTLTIGDSNNLSSTLSSTITGTATGSLVKAGSGLLDISGSGGVSFGTGGTVAVNGGALRIGSGLFSTSATTPITVAAGAELQYSGNGGSKFNDPIQGSGDFNLLGGTVQLTGTNTYTGGTVVQIGATLDVTTANLPTGGAISNAGGTLLFDQTTIGTFSGVMADGQQAGGPNDPNDMACANTAVGIAGVSCSGPNLSGSLIKDDSTTGSGGNVTIANAQSYSGRTYIEAGTLTLGTFNTIVTSQGVDLGRVGGAVCNPSPCSGVTATLALNADNTIGGLEDNPSNSTQVTLNGHTLTLAPIFGSSWTYAGAIVDGSGSGGLTQDGVGTSILTGTSTYSGATAIDEGTLEVNGTISSSGFTINNGGTLVGSGNVDPPAGMTVNPGGIFAPGTPGVPGTFMTVTGNLTFTPGTPASTYVVQLNPATSTYANVTGTASLSGNVLAAFQTGSYTVKQYTILESTGLNGTTFGTLGTANLPAGFAASLSYGANDSNVFLNLAAALGAGAGLSGNQGNVANSLNNFFNSGGMLTPNFATIFGLSGGNLNTALAQLSGEANTGGDNASFTMMSDFLGVMVDPTAGGRSSAPGSAGNAFASEQGDGLPPDVALAYASVLKRPPPLAPFEQRWTAWGQGFGGYNKTDGNAAAGTNTVTASAFGFAGGLDYHFSPDSYAGFAVAGSGSDWSLAQNLGTGRSNSMQFGVYGTSYFGRAYVSGSLGVANNWMTTNRFAPLGDQLRASFNAQSYGARVEGGYRYGAAMFGVTPYAALQTQLFHTPAYSETDLTGGGFGLSYAASNPTDTRSELGARFDSVQVVNQMPLVWRARLAWAHDWVSSPTLTATFETLPGANFVVNGAGMPANSALTTLGAELYMTPQWSFEAKFDGDFANTAQTYAGSGTIKYRW